MAATTVDLAGKVALVTGGAGGVGLGISTGFADAGATVYVCGRSAQAPDGSDPRLRYVSADVRDPDAAARLVATVAGEAARLDVLVNNVGGTPPADAATMSPRLALRVVELNLLAAFYVGQAANTVMQAQDSGGTVINIGSVAGARPAPMSALYGAAKAGLAHLTTSLAVEWAPKVRVNMVQVGLVVTEKAHLFYGDDAGIAAVGRTIPMGRMATPAEVAGPCLFLASDLAAYVSGAVLAVHGGGEPPPYLEASTGEVTSG